MENSTAMQPETVKVFVYGTLKVGGYYANTFNQHRVSAQKATVNGFIYDGMPYPRLRLSENPFDVVHGELHEYKNVQHTLARMDMIEGYRKGRNSNLYERKLVEVHLEDGTIEEAYIYEYAQPLEEGANILPDGNWEI